MQQNMYPSGVSDEIKIVNKIMLLYLINKMDIPMSGSQIAQFALEENFMNYYDFQEYMLEMVNAGYLDKSQDSNTTRYTITEEGLNAIETFIKYVPVNKRNKIISYVSENRKFVKRDFEITANYFCEQNSNEFIVKCGVYEDDLMMMELHVSVVSKKQAVSICNNWKKNVDSLYGKIISTLLEKNSDLGKDSKSDHEQMLRQSQMLKQEQKLEQSLKQEQLLMQEQKQEQT